MQSTQPEFEIVDSKKKSFYMTIIVLLSIKKPNIRFILDVLKNVV